MISSCSEYADAAVGKAFCEAVAANVAPLAVTWSEGTCPTAGALGRCAVPADAASGLPASLDVYYA